MFDPAHRSSPPEGEDVTTVAPGAAEHVYSPSPPFTFLAHAERWDVFLTAKGPEILPVLKRLGHQPGVANVEQVRTQDGHIVGEPSKALAIKRSKEAFIELPAGMTVEAFGKRYRGYVHKYAGTKGAIHLDRWGRLYKVGASSYVERDEVGYHEFLRQVRDQFLGGGPDPMVAQGLKAILTRQLGKARASANKSPTAASSVVLFERKLEAFSRKRVLEEIAAAEAELDRAERTAAPPPPPAPSAPSAPRGFNELDADEPLWPSESVVRQPPEETPKKSSRGSRRG